jgi:hypothetical protein
VLTAVAVLAVALSIDVAQLAMQMHNAVASVAQIRAAVEQRFGGRHMGHTPTPPPPAGS